VRAGLGPAMAKKVQDVLTAITDEQAAAILPKHYTGFVASTHANYKLIEDAGIAVGALKNQK
jgi:phosphonate transport system substrate-binding protein